MILSDSVKLPRLVLVTQIITNPQAVSKWVNVWLLSSVAVTNVTQLLNFLTEMYSKMHFVFSCSYLLLFCQIDNAKKSIHQNVVLLSRMLRITVRHNRYGHDDIRFLHSLGLLTFFNQ